MADNDDLTLLLLFKDQPQLSKGFPLAAQSSTIKSHRETVTSSYSVTTPDTSSKSVRQLNLFGEAPAQVKISIAPDIPSNCCIWGWWRKPWEHNDHLLEKFQKLCSKENKPDVLLYSQYSRKVYKGKLHDVYFAKYASCVEIPLNWFTKCPGYYATDTHRCGAFFALEIEEPRKSTTGAYSASEVFKDYRVDELSFSILRDDFISAVLYPDAKDIKSACQKLIDKAPSPHILKASEHTVFVLRKRSRKDITKGLLLKSSTSDDVLATAFKRTEWQEVKEILHEIDVNTWTRLTNRPRTLEAISNASDNKIIPFDIFLVASALSNKELINDLVPCNELSKDNFKINLVEWLLEEDAFKKRETAARLFNLIWSFIIDRYGLTDLKEYFSKLPIMEGIAYSTQYGIKHKFYRDHLNHNIRSSLLSAYCCHHLLNEVKEKWNITLVAFLAGLLHDIAHPLSSYEKIGKTIEETLRLLKLPTTSRIQSLVNHPEIMQDFCIVTLLSSIKNLRGVQKYHIISPLSKRDDVIKLGDSRLAFEEMACAMCDEHALLSAVAIWNAAFPKGDNKTHKIGTRLADGSKLGDGSINDAQKRAAEFLNLIQCIALHDRKSSGHSLGDQSEQSGIPTPLDFKDFPIPVLTIITDDLQEWGRPIGDFSESLVSNCQIGIDKNKIMVEYTIDANHSTIGNTPYSIIEHTLAKVRNLSQIKYNTNDKFECICKVMVSESMKLINSTRDTGTLAFNNPLKSIWPHKDGLQECSGFSYGQNIVFLSISHPMNNAGKEKEAISDFIVLTIPSHLATKTMLIKESIDILSIEINGLSITINTSAFTIKGEIEEYYKTVLNKDRTRLTPVDTAMVNFDNTISIAKVNLNEIENVHTDTQINIDNIRYLQFKPYPHYLDLDWRFSYETAFLILQFIKARCSGGTVCYLGCPTLAMYHEKYQKMMGPIEYNLYDKGHHGLDVWCKSKIIDERKVIRGNVFDSLRPDLRAAYDVVIVDPPWYKEHYRRFWERSLELVKPKGLIGIVEYPGYDPVKLDLFDKIKGEMVQAIGNKTFFSSIVISYVPPEFEKLTGSNKEFTHDEFGAAYRPAYMDFYQIENVPPRIVKAEPASMASPDSILSEIAELDDGHYLRYRKNIEEYSSSPIGIETRESLERLKKKQEFENIIAWSTANTVVRVVKDGKEKINSVATLCELVRKYEKG